MDELTLIVGGRSHGGWQTVSVSRAMDAGAGTFEIGLTDRWPGQKDSLPIGTGDPCQVKLGPDTVIDGYIDEIRPSYDAEAHAVSVSGRDRTGDLVDCGAVIKGGQWKGAKVDAIARDLCAPFGISVRADTDLGGVFPSFAIQQGESAFATIERACRQRGVLPMPDAGGGLLITRAAKGTHPTTKLARGVNILTAEATFSTRDRYSVYVVKGQRSADATGDNADAWTGLVAKVTDVNVKRHRPLVVIAETPGDADKLKTRALWEARVRAGRSRAFTISVQGWRDAGGKLWAPNTLVEIDDDWLAASGTLLVTGVAFKKGEDGTTTELALMPPSAFDLIPLTDAKEAGW